MNSWNSRRRCRPRGNFGGDRKAYCCVALGDWIPAELAGRPKAGFALPFESWFRGDLNSKIDEILHGPDDVIGQIGAIALWAAFKRGRSIGRDYGQS